MALVKEGNSSNVIVMHCLPVMRTSKPVIQITRYKIRAKACRARGLANIYPCINFGINIPLILAPPSRKPDHKRLLFSFPTFPLSLSRFNSRFRFPEEWETRKKKEITTTRQIETRVKRQVVLEDGEVVVDSGPLVTTNTTEDVEQQEHTTQEVKLDTVP